MAVEPPNPPAEDLNWDEVLAWLPRFTHARFRAGHWAGGEEHAPGVRPMPSVDYTDDVLGFTRQLYDLQVVAPFDWSSVGRRCEAESCGVTLSASQMHHSRSAGCCLPPTCEPIDSRRATCFTPWRADTS